ncbi:oxidoreductase [Melittangium boletus]|uniref:oxidoreductase n=1 Tax=Melittangium boletus TaxID=83453 RepID=UPI003DA33621
METSPRTALVAGASGLVGGALLDTLLEDARYREVHSLGRRPLPRPHPKLVQHTVDFTRLDPQALPAAQDAFCALGTTLKKAGSQAAFRAVDHDYVLAFAHAARRAGAQRFVLVSALGANARSRIFYNRVKGEAEDALRAVGFESLIIVQPSLLLGAREEPRPAEQVMGAVSRVLAPLLRPLAARPIEGRTVARALVALAWRDAPGTRVVPSGELHALGA